MEDDIRIRVEGNGSRVVVSFPASRLREILSLDAISIYGPSLQDRRDKILLALREAGRNGLSVSQLIEALGVDRWLLRRPLRSLVQGKEVLAKGRARARRYVLPDGD